eukprot:COSAG05_NODE_848_length_6985_cov_11.108336_3_plen_133_part_00
MVDMAAAQAHQQQQQEYYMQMQQMQYQQQLQAQSMAAAQNGGQAYNPNVVVSTPTGSAVLHPSGLLQVEAPPGGVMPVSPTHQAASTAGSHKLKVEDSPRKGGGGGGKAGGRGGGNGGRKRYSEFKPAANTQ